jgi:hypothetical protein
MEGNKDRKREIRLKRKKNKEIKNSALKKK